MQSQRKSADRVDAYISTFPPDVQAVLRKIRGVLRRAVPEAEEIISYRMPALRLNGIVLYYAAFKNHIGIYPPIHGSASLERALARYSGEKGNLRLPLDEPIPYRLIERIAKLRAKQNLAKLESKKKVTRS
jgi:uncharacterized protein YdhG (YjbR/CyaY superfamily)